MENSHSHAKPYSVRMPTSSATTRNQPVTMPLDLNRSDAIRNPFIIPGLKKLKVESQLNATWNFDNFIEGDCNRLARSAGYAVANKPGGTAFNPLLLYGAAGVGKTHLAHAIGIEIKEKQPNKTVLYVASERFTLQFIDAVKNNSTNDFVHFYQMIDVLIMDDVQFLAGKEKTQDVFFHIFNHLHQSGKQLVLTSDKAPVEMQGHGATFAFSI
jgi:chromosomal replication initiator protein